MLLADNTVVAAHRAEVRNGDHAEYTLFERKLHDLALDGAELFVTLEPCAPGARSREKTACAQRIVDARIRQVWIGIEDPYPTVAGRGRAFLEASGVSVDRFHDEFAVVVREENATFLEYARRTPAPVTSPVSPPLRSRREPNEDEIEARAELILARVNDLSENLFGSPNAYAGPRWAPLVARDELRKEFDEPADKDAEAT